MANPKWFDANAYMQNKLAQLKAQEPDAGWTLDKVYDTFRDADFVGTEGQYEHFVQYGAAEEVAPNAYFDADEYYAAKAKQYYEEELKQEFTGSEEQIAYVKSLIKDAGMNAWTHYQQFGSAEGVNPSNAFDASDYCAAKAEAMNKAGQKAPDGTDWTAEKIAKAIDDAGMSVLEHYLTYAGTGEGEVAAGSTYPVSGDEQVSKPGETFYLTTDRDSLVGTAGDDVFRATTAEDMGDFDTVDGGAGNDTLEVYTGDKLKGTFTNIENLVVAGDSVSDSGYDLSSFSKSFTLKAEKNAAVSHVTNQTLVMDGVENTTLTATMDAAQTSVKLVNEGSTGATFKADGAKLESVSLTTDADTTLTQSNATVKNVAITALADATITLTDLSVLENVTVTGAGAVELETVTGESVKSVNATDNTGGVDVDLSEADKATFTGGAGDDILRVEGSTVAHTLGAGDDTMQVNNTLAEGFSVDGGEGTDTLILTSDVAKDVTADVFNKTFTNFEELSLSSSLSGDLDISGYTGIDHLTLIGADDGKTITMQSGSTLELTKGEGTGTYAGTLTVNVADAAAGKADVLNIALTGATAVDGKTIAVADVETINIVATDTDLTEVNKHSLTLKADDATTVKVSGDAGLELTLTDSDAVKTIDASESTGGVKITDSSVLKGVTFTGGAGDDTVTLGAGNTVTGGAGKDIFNISNTAVNDRSVITDFGAGDTIKMGNFTVTNADTTHTLGDALVVNDPKATLNDYVNAATAEDKAGVAWFQYEGNTYVVVNDATHGFAADADYIVQLSGSVDLSDAVMSNGSLTLPEGA